MLNILIKVINNAVLKDVGFLGFQLVPHLTIKYAYVMERTDGSPAKDPSEGEKNLIAFLYFYEKVKGYGVVESSSIISVDGEEKKLFPYQIISRRL